MIRQPVASSNIKSIGYESSSEVLEIEFHSGGIYQYYSVPEVIWFGLMHAPSHGRYFHAKIRNRFNYIRIR
jgi:hypothetical protein